MLLFRVAMYANIILLVLELTLVFMQKFQNSCLDFTLTAHTYHFILLFSKIPLPAAIAFDGAVLLYLIIMGLGRKCKLLVSIFSLRSSCIP